MAAQIAAAASGTESKVAFDGKAACYICTGLDEAVHPEAAFLEVPHPVVKFGAPSADPFHAKLQEVHKWRNGVFD